MQRHMAVDSMLSLALGTLSSRVSRSSICVHVRQHLISPIMGRTCTQLAALSSTITFGDQSNMKHVGVEGVVGNKINVAEIVLGACLFRDPRSCTDLTRRRLRRLWHYLFVCFAVSDMHSHVIMLVHVRHLSSRVAISDSLFYWQVLVTCTVACCHAHLHVFSFLGGVREASRLGAVWLKPCESDLPDSHPTARQRFAWSRGSGFLFGPV